MPIFLAAGKNAAECRRIVEGRGGEFHVYEFQGADGVSPFADHAPEINHTVIGLKDPAGDDKWGDSELTALLYHAAAIKELLKVNANVLVICRGGNNRSRTLAGIAERLLDLETGETVAEGRTLPVDSELCKLVEVFDDRNAATRAEKITRSASPRRGAFFLCIGDGPGGRSGDGPPPPRVLSLNPLRKRK